MTIRKKNYNSVLIYLAIFLTAFFAFSNQAKAADTGSGTFLSVAPHTFDISVEQGEKVKKKIKLYNRGSFAVPFKIRVIDFDAINGTGEMKAVDLEDSSDSAVGWFEFENKNFIIDPAEKKDIEFTINVPRDAKQQGFYASVMLEADISTYLYNESKLQVIPHIGVLFMIKVGQADLSSDLEVVEYTVVDEDRLERMEKVVNFITSPLDSEEKQVDVTDTERPRFLVRLKNNSPYHQKLEGNIKLSGVGWSLEDELDFSEITILPGKTRDILVMGATDQNNSNDERVVDQSEKNGGFGLMQAELNLETSEGIEKNESKWVMVYSWKIWAIVFFIGFGLFFAIKFSKKGFAHLHRSKSKKKRGTRKSVSKRAKKDYNKAKIDD